jgi:cytochrome c oxidase subunit II
MSLQPAATSIKAETVWLDNMLLWIITPITILVMALLLWVIVFHNRRANPVPARFTHNSPLEVAWTVVPILILIFIGSFTVPALFRQQIMPEADVTIKVTGYQWHWGYEYVDHDVEFPASCWSARNWPSSATRIATTCWPPTPPWWCRWAATW